MKICKCRKFLKRCKKNFFFPNFVSTLLNFCAKNLEFSAKMHNFQSTVTLIWIFRISSSNMLHYRLLSYRNPKNHFSEFFRSNCCILCDYLTPKRLQYPWSRFSAICRQICSIIVFRATVTPKNHFSAIFREIRCNHLTPKCLQ